MSCKSILAMALLVVLGVGFVKAYDCYCSIPNNTPCTDDQDCYSVVCNPSGAYTAQCVLPVGSGSTQQCGCVPILQPLVTGCVGGILGLNPLLCDVSCDLQSGSRATCGTPV